MLTSSPCKQSLGEPSTSKNVPKQAKVKKSTEKKKASNLENDDTPCDDTPCVYCNGFFSEDIYGEQSMQCVSCNKWWHTKCVGVESGAFQCDCCVESE